MRYKGNTHKKRGSGRVWALPILPFAVLVALILPVGAGAGVKQEAADPTVRLSAAVFGLGHAAATAAVSLDGNSDDMGEKCMENCDEPAGEIEPVVDEDPFASWAGVPLGLPHL